jgi:hypothetical protein
MSVGGEGQLVFTSLFLFRDAALAGLRPAHLPEDRISPVKRAVVWRAAQPIGFRCLLFDALQDGGARRACGVRR